MSDDMARLRDEVAEVLGEHAYADDTAMVGQVAAQCACGWIGRDRDIYALRARHDAHRARALAPLLARKVAEARGEAWNRAERANRVLDDWQRWGRDHGDMAVTLLRVRAALTPPPGPENGPERPSTASGGRADVRDDNEPQGEK